LFNAASVISVQNNLAYLKFNCTTILSEKYATIAVPNDEYMPKRIKFFGYWSKELSIFLASGMKKNTALLDLGAHCGLVSLQTFNLGLIQKIYLVEPKADNLSALRNNLQKIDKLCEVSIIDAAITDNENETGNLYSELGATMNSSINPILPGVSFTNKSKIDVEKVKTISAPKLCKNFLKWVGDSDVALKSDLQGMDVKILSQFSNVFWLKVSIGSIEICSIEYAREKEINLLLSKLKIFEHIYTDYNLTKKITSNAIAQFYLGKSGKAINIFFKRNLN
jgi:FkbM family methyltransferase